jgi:CTP:molybdopterin cytidylyltransferase MocA
MARMAGAGAPTAIVLAAGGATRLGRDKLLLDMGGMPMLQRTVS